MDNLVFTDNNTDILIDLYKNSINRMQEGNFNLRSWNTNNPKLKQIMISDSKLVNHSSEFEKVLGYKYHCTNDSLHISEVELPNVTPTKRLILSQTSKIYDPLSLALPVTVGGKLIVKSLWEAKYDWDDEISPELAKEWEKLKKDLVQISNISFPRQVLNERISYGINVFTDGSSSCYGFVVYACSDDKNTLLFSKAKVTPLKQANKMSIPLIEMLGLLLSLKCIFTILDAYSNIHFEYINFNLDAQVVLNWILTGEAKVKNKYVNNRIKDCISLINKVKVKYKLPIYFHYVNTSDNVADLVTKNISFKRFTENLKFWLTGPSWLTKDLKKRPNSSLLSVASEVRNLTQTNVINVLSTNSNNSNNDEILNIDNSNFLNNIDVSIYNDNLNDCNVNLVNNNVVNVIKIDSSLDLIDINKYSSFEKLINVTTLCFKPFCKFTKEDPYKKAWLYWIKKVQHSCYSDEIEFLNNPTNRNIPLLVNNLNLFSDSLGVLRSKGRISKCTYFDYDVINPVILSRFHPFTSLFIMNCHKRVQHLGQDITLTYIRNKGVWIPKGRIAVKKVLNSCTLCKKFNVNAFKYPKFTDIPKHHVSLVKPFEFVAVDFTSHIFVKNEITNTLDKFYILIFTCLNIRAIHLELLPDMSVNNFLLAFQRFCNMYSLPKVLYSDNAKTFTKGSVILKEALESDEFQQELKNNNIKSIKIPLYSAWWGSYWERMIKTVKQCMYKVIGRSKLTYFELLTNLSFIKNAVNSRPLTYRSESENLSIITPNSFLRSNCNSSLILREEDDNVWQDTDSSTLNHTLDKQEELFNHFKTLWYEEYLLNLREQSNNLFEVNWENKIKVNDIVLIKNPVKPRPFWLLGKVEELIIGYDNKIRAVKVKQGNNQTNFHSLKNLYPLELSLSHTKTSPHVGDNNVKESLEVVENKNKDNNKVVARPKRQAALRLDKFIKSNLKDL